MYKILFDKDPKCGLKVQALLTIIQSLSNTSSEKNFFLLDRVVLVEKGYLQNLQLQKD